MRDEISVLPQKAAAHSAATVVVVDDDADLRALIAEFLAENGLTVMAAGDAAALDACLAERPVDLVILDVMMPGEDGLSVLRRMQGGAAPSIIMLSAMGDDYDRIAGLEMGADDYLAKPCNPRELLARVRAVLRRREENLGGFSARARRFGDWTLNLITRLLSHVDGREAQLTDAEFRVLTALLDRPQTVLSRDQLLDVARGEGVEIYDRAIDVTVSRLRRKLAPDDPIKTVRNEGYMIMLMQEQA